MTIDKRFESLFHSRVQFQGRERQVELRVPAFGEIFALVLESQHRTPERMSVMFPAEFKRLIKSLGENSVGIEHARALYADAQAAGQIVAARNRLFETLAEQGLLYAQCPHCLNWEAEVSIVALTVALQAGPWPIIDGRMFLAVPSLSSRLPRGIRPAGVPGTSRVRFDLPSSVFRLTTPIRSGTLGAADRNNGTSERAAWARWVTSREVGISGREQWREDVPGFRAALRLAVALEHLQGIEGEITPEVVLDMLSVDFYFLDNLHYLVHNVDLQNDKKASINCEACGLPFLLIVD